MDIHYTERDKIETPNGDKKVLLHSCCAPCSGEVMEAMHASGIDFTIYFYNPNIHPRDEYDIKIIGLHALKAKSGNLNEANAVRLALICVLRKPPNTLTKMILV